MAPVLQAGLCALLGTAALLVMPGCQLGARRDEPRAVTATAPVGAPTTPHPDANHVTTAERQALRRTPPNAAPIVRPAAHQEVVAAGLPPDSAHDGLFAGEGELNLQQLTGLVFARNASLQAMTFAWRSATQRYPQAISLDDPIFMGMIAPASANSSLVETGYQVGASQKLPWFGERSARGALAQADASAAFHDVRDARLQLAQTTRAAYFEYYLIARELEINRANLDLTREFRETAQTKYQNNQVTQQDVLQADVEYGTTERRLLEFERAQRIAIARLNTLLRREPDQWLPPPPRDLAAILDLPPIASLREVAITQRPDLAAIAARVRSERAAVTLANKQFYPDTEIYGRYDTFWQPASTQGPLRGQVGVNLNMPIYRNKLKAAVSEAQFRLSQRQAEYNQKLVDVQFEVESAHAQVLEAQKAIQLYREKLLPAAEQTVAATRANYDAGTTTFLNVLTAQQLLLQQREQYQQSVAGYQSRLAELERAVGGPVPNFPRPETLPDPEFDGSRMIIPSPTGP